MLLVEIEEGMLGVIVDFIIGCFFDFNDNVIVINVQGIYNDQLEEVDLRLLVLISYINDDCFFGVLVFVLFFLQLISNVGLDIGCWEDDGFCIDFLCLGI